MNLGALTLSLSLPLLAGEASSASPKPATSTYRLESPEGLQAVNARLQAVTYRGRRAIRLLPLPGHANRDEELDTSPSTCGQPTAGPRIRSGATIRCSTCRSPSSPGSA